MRELGLPKVLTWRWAPCVALSLGACSFAAFAMLVIPERIGNLNPSSSSAASFGLEASLAGTTPQATNDRTGASSSNESSSSLGTSPANQGMARAVNLFPKRGFSPPLERPEPPAPPPPMVPPPPALDPATVQPPPPAPSPAPPPAQEAPPPAPAPAPEPVSMPAPADAPAADTPSRQAD